VIITQRHVRTFFSTADHESMSAPDHLARILSAQITTGALDWGRYQVTKRDRHGKARRLLESTFRALAIIEAFAVLSAVHPIADINAASQHVR
jgi:hypothetical protein